MDDISREMRRIDEIATLSDGWLDGEGRAPTAEAIKSALLLATATRPGLYSIFPRICGGIQFENGEQEAVEFCIEASGTITTEVI